MVGFLAGFCLTVFIYLVLKIVITVWIDGRRERKQSESIKITSCPANGSNWMDISYCGDYTIYTEYPELISTKAERDEAEKKRLRDVNKSI